MWTKLTIIYMKSNSGQHNKNMFQVSHISQRVGSYWSPSIMSHSVGQSLNIPIVPTLASGHSGTVVSFNYLSVSAVVLSCRGFSLLDHSDHFLTFQAAFEGTQPQHESLFAWKHFIHESSLHWSFLSEMHLFFVSKRYFRWAKYK